MMTIAAIRPLLRCPGPWLGAALLALAGCATDGGLAAPDGAARDKGVEAPAPAQASTAAAGGHFSAALRCMDTLLLDHGTRDVSLIVEDLADRTQRANAGTKDMLVSSLSDMTQRSHAIRLVASGQDWGHTVNVMAQASKREPYALAPQYALRGSIRTLDASAGVATLGIDLSLLSTQDMSIVPGTATHNVLTLRQRAGGASGLDGQAELRKFGQSIHISPAPTAIARRRRCVRWSNWRRSSSSAGSPTCPTGTASAPPTLTPPSAPRSRTGTTRWPRARPNWCATSSSSCACAASTTARSTARQRRVQGCGGALPRGCSGLSREAQLSLDFFKAYLGADHQQLAATAQLARGGCRGARPRPDRAHSSLRVATRQ